MLKSAATNKESRKDYAVPQCTPVKKFSSLMLSPLARRYTSMYKVLTKGVNVRHSTRPTIFPMGLKPIQCEVTSNCLQLICLHLRVNASDEVFLNDNMCNSHGEYYLTYYFNQSTVHSSAFILLVFWSPVTCQSKLHTIYIICVQFLWSS